MPETEVLMEIQLNPCKTKEYAFYQGTSQTFNRKGLTKRIRHSAQ